jgi:hypothetical protein
MTERHQSHRALGESAPNPLEAIVGRWRTDGQVIAKEPVPVWGSDVYEMFPGGHFLIHHVDVTVGQSPVRAIEIIGERDDADALLARAYDDGGATTLMAVRIDQAGVWHFTGGSDVAPAAHIDADAAAARGVRSTLSVAADGQTMTAFWGRTEDGQTWQPWMDIRFTRAADASATG